MRRIRPRKFIRRYGVLLLLLITFVGYNGYLIYDRGTERWAADTAELYNHALERITASLTPDYSKAGEGGHFVTRVVDGDTIHVRDKRGTMKVRLHGIDTPERGSLMVERRERLWPIWWRPNMCGWKKSIPIDMGAQSPESTLEKLTSIKH